MVVLQLCLLTLFVASTKSTYMFSNFLKLDNGNYNVSWNFNASSDTLEFLVEVRATGYVAFGVAENPTGMQGYDVAIGGVMPNGTGYLQDYLTVGLRKPQLDTQHDWMLVNSSEDNGVTTLKFYRKRNTTDQQNDTAIPVGMPIYVVWAYHSSSDTLVKHEEKGSRQVTLIPADASTTTMMMTMTTTPTPTASEATSMSMSHSTSQQETTETTSTPTPMTSSVMMPVSNSHSSMTPTMTVVVATLESPSVVTDVSGSDQMTSTQTITPTATAPTPTVTPSVAMPMPMPMHFPNFLSLQNGKYNVSWMFNSSMDTLHFMVEVMATGWIGFGFYNQMPPANPSMVGYDVAVGRVSGGVGEIQDYLTNGRRVPPLDDQQDWTLTYSSEYNGVTKLRFYRKLNTSDDKDIVIQPGVPVYLIWAYHPTNDTISFHNGNRGFTQATLVPTPPGTTVMMPNTPTPTAVTPTASMAMPMPMPMHFSNFLSLQNGKYNVSWMFNSSMDTLHFMVEVMATGWIGFGFYNQMPPANPSMVGYDVAVGRVSGGVGEIQDYLTNGRNSPPLDDQQDWTLTYSSEYNGVTKLRFYRKLNTSDDKDIVIQPGVPVYLIWAYHPTNDTISFHNGNRGFTQATLVPTPPGTTVMMPNTPTPTAVTPTASMAIPMPMPMPMHFPNFLSLQNGKYNVSWMFNSSMDTLHFMVEVMATGWIGFGFYNQMPPANPSMVGYDVAVGRVSGGVGEIQDYLTNGRRVPPLDDQQDWTLTYSSEYNGVTKLRFYRKLNTSDDKDIVIQPGVPVYLIWAYHPTSDDIDNHGNGNRGFTQATLVPTPPGTTVMMPNTPTPTAVTPTASMAMPMPMPMHFPNFLSLQNGKYNVSWMFNSSMDTLHFMVEVMATGWIGFGFSAQKPPTSPSMVGYDVAVGKVTSGVGELKDYLTNGPNSPPLDDQQDWTLTYSSEYNGVTKLRFYRKLNTGDEKDIVIQPGVPVYLIWAYESTNDAISYHGGNRGFIQATLVPAITPTETPQFTHSFNNNQFRLLWKFDDQRDMMYYHLRVKTTGWVGFGFARTAPNNMQGYDVIVGGFKDGKGYLNDYYTRGRTRPQPDANQDYTLLSASEQGGYTELKFERKRDTGDNNDIQFEVEGAVHLIWAYGTNDIIDENNFNIHSARGWSQDKYAMVGEAPIPTEVPTTQAAASFLHTRISAVIAFTIALVVLNILVL